jgi:uncharacterized membrane protein
MSERKLVAWEAAGLIDAATAARIRAWEAEHSRPLGLWAVIGIAALAIGLGLISVVAANWDAVPGIVRLALHFALLAGAVALLWTKGPALGRERPWLHEAALFVFALLGLTFFGHLGQVYQTSSPLWQPLLAWLALFAPLLASRGLGTLTAATLFAALVYGAWDYVVWLDRFSSREGNVALDVWRAAVTAAPLLIAPLAAWMHERSDRPVFWRRLGQFAVAYGVAGASLLAIACAVDDFSRAGGDILSAASLATQAVVGLVAGLLVVLLRPTPAGRATGSILAGAGIVAILAYPLSGNSLAGGLLFMALWAGIAVAGLVAGWRGVFQLAVGFVALRLIVLSFELASDLLTSGAGLIASGLLILGIAWLALRVARRFAPDRETGA